MPDFAYANARLRAMRSNLLDRGAIERLSDAGSLAELIRRLASTPYQHALEAAFLHASELEMVLEAIRQDFNAALVKIRGFYPAEKPCALDLVLRAYDIHNLKSVLRGLEHRVPPAEIHEAFYPPGELSEFVIAELLTVSSPRAAIDRLASLGHPLAAPLVALRVDHPGADLFEMDLALDQWRHAQSRLELGLPRFSSSGRGGRGNVFTRSALTHPPLECPLLLEWLNLEADITNLMVVLRLLHNPAERQALAERLAGVGIERLLVAPGRLPVSLLVELSALKNVAAALKTLESAPVSAPGGISYGALLAGALPAYQRGNHLSELEAALRHYQAGWQISQIGRDPLGEGVLLGFLSLKAQEAANLRRIASGTWRVTAPQAIRARLGNAP